jgi:hypothetical protein
MERYAAQRGSYRLTHGWLAGWGLGSRHEPAERPASRLPWPIAMRIVVLLALALWIGIGVATVLFLRWLLH